DSKGVVPALICLLARLKEVTEVAFQGDASFGMALKEAFEDFLNAGTPNLPAKLLARHLDALLRGDSMPAATPTSSQQPMTPPPSAASQRSLLFSPKPRRRSDEANEEQGIDSVEAGIRKAMSIFRFVAAKDAFEAFFKKDLARRLLLQRSASLEAELCA
ncbi:unnamed protein product, partial [Polarella glacialis]